MASAPASSVGSVVVDANILIAICAREKDKFSKAETALKDCAARGSVFYAPGSPKFSSSHERYPAATTW